MWGKNTPHFLEGSAEGSVLAREPATFATRHTFSGGCPHAAVGDAQTRRRVPLRPAAPATAAAVPGALCQRRRTLPLRRRHSCGCVLRRRLCRAERPPTHRPRKRVAAAAATGKPACPCGRRGAGTRPLQPVKGGCVLLSRAPACGRRRRRRREQRRCVACVAVALVSAGGGRVLPDEGLAVAAAPAREEHNACAAVAARGQRARRRATSATGRDLLAAGGRGASVARHLHLLDATRRDVAAVPVETSVVHAVAEAQHVPDERHPLLLRHALLRLRVCPVLVDGEDRHVDSHLCEDHVRHDDGDGRRNLREPRVRRGVLPLRQQDEHKHRGLRPGHGDLEHVLVGGDVRPQHDEREEEGAYQPQHGVRLDLAPRL
eukprot:Rhum_TRINITY_DN667_c0_g1::Rhum_TRINITY_DN667_c0_g1_i1::g.2077::m.2077